jgi:hypothetical protein
MFLGCDFSNGDKYEQNKIVIPTRRNIHHHLAIWIATVVRQMQAAARWKISREVGSIDAKPGATGESFVDGVVANRDALGIIQNSDIVTELSVPRDASLCC